MENRILTPEEANKVYDILVIECGDSEKMRDAFIQTQTTELCREWRFCGHLGFGGKFWNANDKWYVNYYPEDETPEREIMVGMANIKLSRLTQGVKITLQLPAEAAAKILKGWQEQDPVLLDMLKEFGVREVSPHED